MVRGSAAAPPHRARLAATAAMPRASTELARAPPLFPRRASVLRVASPMPERRVSAEAISFPLISPSWPARGAKVARRAVAFEPGTAFARASAAVFSMPAKDSSRLDLYSPASVSPSSRVLFSFESCAAISSSASWEMLATISVVCVSLSVMTAAFAMASPIEPEILPAMSASPAMVRAVMTRAVVALTLLVIWIHCGRYSPTDELTAFSRAAALTSRVASVPATACRTAAR
mmetsp:Transcript_40149/g.106285  ORF Transcript_40149/g.106285 Transcript_40149/m.106285 type:complete len:232 (+) Transcript_40149:33-728(+)